MRRQKTGEENWMPPFNLETGAPLYPEPMAELDAIKRGRIGDLKVTPSEGW